MKIYLLTIVVSLLLISIVSCSSPKKVKLSKTGDCPVISAKEKVQIDGYIIFGSPGKGAGKQHGKQGEPPYFEFFFASEPEVNTQFKIAITEAQAEESNANKINEVVFDPEPHNVRFLIYDWQGNEVNLILPLRITGVVIDPCVVRVGRIEKLLNL